MEIKLYDTAFNLVGIIDEYISLIWTERFDCAGDFELLLPARKNYMDLIRLNYFLYNPKTDRHMIILTINLETLENDYDKIKISGKSIEYILSRRVIFPKVKLSGDLQTQVQQLLNVCIINPENPLRKIERFNFVQNTDGYFSGRTIRVHYLGENLYDAICDICTRYSIGFKIYVVGKTFNFKLLRGRNTNIMFSKKMDNLKSSSYLTSLEVYKSNAIIYDDKHDISLTYGDENASGLNRYEQFLTFNQANLNVPDDININDEDLNNPITLGQLKILVSQKYKEIYKAWLGLFIDQMAFSYIFEGMKSVKYSAYRKSYENIGYFSFRTIVQDALNSYCWLIISYFYHMVAVSLPPPDGAEILDPNSGYFRLTKSEVRTVQSYETATSPSRPIYKTYEKYFYSDGVVTKVLTDMDETLYGKRQDRDLNNPNQLQNGHYDNYDLEELRDAALNAVQRMYTILKKDFVDDYGSSSSEIFNTYSQYTYAKSREILNGIGYANGYYDYKKDQFEFTDISSANEDEKFVSIGNNTFVSNIPYIKKRDSVYETADYRFRRYFYGYFYAPYAGVLKIYINQTTTGTGVRAGSVVSTTNIRINGTKIEDENLNNNSNFYFFVEIPFVQGSNRLDIRSVVEYDVSGYNCFCAIVLELNYHEKLTDTEYPDENLDGLIGINYYFKEYIKTRYNMLKKILVDPIRKYVYDEDSYIDDITELMEYETAIESRQKIIDSLSDSYDKLIRSKDGGIDKIYEFLNLDINSAISAKTESFMYLFYKLTGYGKSKITRYTYDFAYGKVLYPIEKDPDNNDAITITKKTSDERIMLTINKVYEDNVKEILRLYNRYFIVLLKEQLAFGNEFALINHMKNNSLEAEIISELYYKYNQDYFLGDFVRFENEYGINKKVTIKEYVQSDNLSDGKTEYPTFEVVEEGG